LVNSDPSKPGEEQVNAFSARKMAHKLPQQYGVTWLKNSDF
jgi:hypothetical protein